MSTSYGLSKETVEATTSTPKKARPGSPTRRDPRRSVITSPADPFVKRIKKYAAIVALGRKTVYDADLPPWAAGHLGGYKYGSVTHVDKMDAASLKGPVRPNLISSKIKDGLHMPIFDVDMPVHLIESQTPGHYHVAIDKIMSESEYFDFLDAMASFGIVEEGYAEMSRKRGASLVRVVDDEELTLF